MGLGEKNQKEVATMYYAGIDLHKKTSFITTIDARGRIVTRANLQNARSVVGPRQRIEMTIKSFCLRGKNGA
jgi:hypothetical protein